jgi:hypothetical protein
LQCFWLRQPLAQHRSQTAIPYFVGPKDGVLTGRQLPDACSVQRCSRVPGYGQCSSTNYATKDYDGAALARPGSRNGLIEDHSGRSPGWNPLPRTRGDSTLDHSANVVDRRPSWSEECLRRPPLAEITVERTPDL